MITDWKKEIVVAGLVQEETAKLDIQKQWDYYLPNVAATERDLLRTETILEHPLDPRYREFLKYANGWRCFYQRVDLFGTEDLGNGVSMQMAYLLLDAIAAESLGNSRLARADLLPIAVSSTDVDLFVMTHPASSDPGIVIWFAGYEVQRFVRFDDFFLAMVDYNRLRYQRFYGSSGNRVGKCWH